MTSGGRNKARPVSARRALRVMSPAHRLRIGDVQHGALAIYVFDPAVNCVVFDDDVLFPGSLSADRLTVDAGGETVAADLLTAGANSADVDDDRQLRDALTAIAARVRRRPA